MARFNDASGTITTGGTAQVALAAQGAGLSVTIQNRSSGNLYINTTGAAVVAANGESFEVIPNGTFQVAPSQGIGTPAISIIGAVTGQEFTLKYEVFE